MTALGPKRSLSLANIQVSIYDAPAALEPFLVDFHSVMDFFRDFLRRYILGACYADHPAQAKGVQRIAPTSCRSLSRKAFPPEVTPQMIPYFRFGAFRGLLKGDPTVADDPSRRRVNYCPKAEAMLEVAIE